MSEVPLYPRRLDPRRLVDMLRVFFFFFFITLKPRVE